MAGWIGDGAAPEAEPVEMPRIALVETSFHDMDAGWTRYLFDSYHIPFQVLHPGQLRDSDLAGTYDVIVFPDNDKSILMTGKRKSGEEYYLGDYHLSSNQLCRNPLGPWQWLEISGLRGRRQF